MGNRAAVDVVAENSDKHPEEEEDIKPVMSSNYNALHASRFN